MKRQRPAFTLVEILTAVAIIGILMAMTFLGMKYISASVSAGGSEVVLQNARNMLNEYEHRGGSMQKLLNVYYADPATHDNKSCWENAPTESMEEGGKGRQGPQILKTQRVLRRLAAIPEVREIFNAIPAKAKMPVTFIGGLKYAAGDQLAVDLGGGQYKYYSAVNTATTPPPGSNWDEVTYHTPLLLDAFNCPVLFAPGEFHGVAIFDQATNTSTQRVIKAPDLRPFFISAGDDHLFSNLVSAAIPHPSAGSDNVYSFQK